LRITYFGELVVVIRLPVSKDVCFKVKGYCNVSYEYQLANHALLTVIFRKVIMAYLTRKCKYLHRPIPWNKVDNINLPVNRNRKIIHFLGRITTMKFDVDTFNSFDNGTTIQMINLIVFN
jgi:hypothetical protein